MNTDGSGETNLGESWKRASLVTRWHTHRLCGRSHRRHERRRAGSVPVSTAIVPGIRAGHPTACASLFRATSKLRAVEGRATRRSTSVDADGTNEANITNTDNDVRRWVSGLVARRHAIAYPPISGRSELVPIFYTMDPDGSDVIRSHMTRFGPAGSRCSLVIRGRRVRLRCAPRWFPPTSSARHRTARRAAARIPFVQPAAGAVRCVDGWYARCERPSRGHGRLSCGCR